MRKIGFSPYRKRTKEVLPKTYQIGEREQQRKMFFTLINDSLPKEARISLKNRELFQHDLLTIFTDKVQSFFQFYRLRPERARPLKRIYAQESLLFDQFFKQCDDAKAQFMSKGLFFEQRSQMHNSYKHPAAELIRQIFNGKDIEMMLDLNTLFRQTVYRRIKREAGKKVTLDTPYIHIDQHGTRTRLHPRWKHVDPKDLGKRDRDIEDGFSQLHKEEIDQCYLVYPKTDTFKRHITLKDGSSERLKMIPYSFTFCNRERR